MKQTTKYAYRISLRDTLRRMDVGEEIIIPEKDFRAAVVFNAARKLREEGMRFTVSVKGILDTRVTRTL